MEGSWVVDGGRGGAIGDGIILTVGVQYCA